jgi:hypothetical protein
VQEKESVGQHCGTSVPENWNGYGYCVRKVPAFAG